MGYHRSLPADYNPMLSKEKTPSHNELVERRRLGQTILAVNAKQIGNSSATRPENLGKFDYAHLRAPLPRNLTGSEIFGSGEHAPPESYFLMRRSTDGYISATGMFKASFPWASLRQEEDERKYIKSLESTSTEETAGNVWIKPTHALELAEEYRILPWIQALLDSTPISIAGSQKSISTPPRFVPPKNAVLPPPTATPTPRTKGKGSRRSVSPNKAAASAKKNASPRKQLGSKAANTAHANAASATLQAALSSAASVADSEASTDNEKVKVEVHSSVAVNGDVETTKTNVIVEMPAGAPEFPLPESTEEMIAKAKEMVDSAQKLDKSNAEKGSAKKSKSKRKAEVVEDGDGELQKAKKTKLAEQEVKKVKVRTKALIGLSATLALGAAIPYFL